MSRYNWNWRQGNMFGSSNPAPPRATDPTQIACKLCDRVFLSTKALIAHIESHLADDDLSTTARLRQLNLPNSTDPFISSNAPLRPSTNPFHQRSLFHGVNNQICFVPSPAPPPPPQTHYQFPHPQQPQQPQVPHYLLPRNPNVNSGAAGSHHMMMPYGNQMAHVVREENHSDSTRPFLSQLQRPIPSINFGLDASGNANFDNLDLALKL